LSRRGKASKVNNLPCSRWLGIAHLFENDFNLTTFQKLVSQQSRFLTKERSAKLELRFLQQIMSCCLLQLSELSKDAICRRLTGF
jgi:hypothetical protein